MEERKVMVKIGSFRMELWEVGRDYWWFRDVIFTRKVVGRRWCGWMWGEMRSLGDRCCKILEKSVEIGNFGRRYLGKNGELGLDILGGNRESNLSKKWKNRFKKRGCYRRLASWKLEACGASGSGIIFVVMEAYVRIRIESVWSLLEFIFMFFSRWPL